MFEKCWTKYSYMILGYIRIFYNDIIQRFFKTFSQFFDTTGKAELSQLLTIVFDALLIKTMHF